MHARFIRFLSCPQRCVRSRKTLNKCEINEKKNRLQMLRKAGVRTGGPSDLSSASPGGPSCSIRFVHDLAATRVRNGQEANLLNWVRAGRFHALLVASALVVLGTERCARTTSLSRPSLTSQHSSRSSPFSVASGFRLFLPLWKVKFGVPPVATCVRVYRHTMAGPNARMLSHLCCAVHTCAFDTDAKCGVSRAISSIFWIRSDAGTSTMLGTRNILSGQNEQVERSLWLLQSDAHDQRARTTWMPLPLVTQLPPRPTLFATLS